MACPHCGRRRYKQVLKKFSKKQKGWVKICLSCEQIYDMDDLDEKKDENL